MEHLKFSLSGYIFTTVTFGWIGDIGMAFILGFIGAFGGLFAKLLYDLIKKKIK
ncbi:hypothetical protein LCGC14_0463620 [marine sediment metagenome]|uniref:Uncharacterized protein n=1 Tax=marine sediment metagenome TaxID=412755 RepID=A0A0F9SJH1_9ZZZZ